MKEKLVVALDVNTREEALKLVDRLRDHVGLFKVGLELFTACGPDIVHAIDGGEVFLDLKFHDIPNTVAGAARQATRMGVRMFNVHAAGGVEMMAAARAASRAACEGMGGQPPLVLGVTVLTSLDEAMVREQLLVPKDCEEYVAHLARLAQRCGLDGVVCSPREIPLVREACGDHFVIVTPGVRPAQPEGPRAGGARPDDQKRILTPGQAIAAGANFIVVGRPITGAGNPSEAAERIVEEMACTPAN